jgi:hypothetical protein
MSKLDQIQAALKEINEAKFQKLCDAYLHKQGYERINPKGSVIGKEKTAKGRPDSWIPLSNGNFVFAEHTTIQEAKLFDKLCTDLEECFDQSKTGIPVSKIEKVIFCHNSSLEPDEEEALAEKCHQHGAMFEDIGIGPLSFGLYQKYPSLAKDFLGIEVDTGQILSPLDFVTQYQKSAFAIPLDTQFHFREEELNAVMDALESNDLVIITGRAGVGKSRFALECSKRFSEKYTTYKVYCILNKGLSIYEDLKAYFSAVGDYLILVDDANRVSQLGLMLSLLNDQNTHHHVKILITVRDYAIERVRGIAKSYPNNEVIFLGPFDRNQLQVFLSAEFGIKNALYLERIWDISQGNPRLAVMAAQIAIDEQRLASISDVSTLYDEYFNSLTEDLHELGEANLLKAAGIISFFGFLDRKYEDRFNEVAGSFGLSGDELWRNAEKLHEMEVVDLHEGEVVKISDQVLSTYIFYKVFIKDQILDFAALLDHFFDGHEHKFKDAVHPVFEAFNRQYLVSRIQKQIDHKWELIKSDEVKLLKFADVFWFLKETDTLLFLKERIDSFEPKAYDISSLRFEPDTQSLTDSYIDILRRFGYSSNDNLKIALDLILAYLEKRPEILPQVLRIFLEDFCFNQYSYLREYSIQATLIKELMTKSEGDENSELYRRIFLRIANKYLNTKFRSDRMEGKSTIVSVEFCLFTSPEINKLRQSIWDYLFALYCILEYRDDVLKVVSQYSKDGWNNPVDEIIDHDSRSLLPFIATTLNPERYDHCVVVQDCLEFLERHKISYDPALKAKFVNETYRLSKVLLDDLSSQLEMGFDQYQEHKAQLFKSYFADYSFSDYAHFLKLCAEIFNSLPENEISRFHQHFGTVLVDLAEADPETFRAVISHFLRNGNQLRYSDYRVVGKLILVYKKSRYAYNLLKKYDYTLKQTWLFSFLIQLGEKRANKFYLNELYELYQNADTEEIPSYFDFLDSYVRLDKKVYVKVIRILLDRVVAAKARVSFRSFFDRYPTDAHKLSELFDNDLDLLKLVYFYETTVDRYFDYNCSVFSTILELDPNFVINYLDFRFKQLDYQSLHDDGRDYTFIWRLDNYEAIISDVLHFTCEQLKSGFLIYEHSFLVGFFENKASDPLIDERIDNCLSSFIEDHHADVDSMRFIFEMVTGVLPHKRKHFLEIFLRLNEDYEVFETLQIEPGSYAVSVPVFESHIKFLESLFPLLNTTNLLKHRLYVEKQIRKWKQRIESETRRAFVGEFW